MIPTLIVVWPKPGEVVPHEFTRKPITPGQQVQRTRYILRRLHDGSLTETPPPAPPEPTPEPAPAPAPAPEET